MHHGHRPFVSLAFVLGFLAGASPTVRAQVFDYAIEGRASGDALGTALSRIGDVDLDGCEDFAVGAQYGHSGDGEVLLFSGRTGAEIARLHGKYFSRFGVAIDGRIDVDLDGFPDVLIGAPDDDTNAVGAGRFLVYSPHLDTILLDLHGTIAHAKLGQSVRALGDDLDGDGVEDFMVGAPGSDTASVRSGATGGVIFQKTGQAGSSFGMSVSTGGRIDGDGFVDFVVGSPEFKDTSGNYVGRVSAFSGKDGSKLWSVDGFSNSEFGSCVAHPGDLDGDSRGDVVVGAPGILFGGTSITGSATAISGATGAVLYTVFGTNYGDAFGTSVRSAAGDIDDDGVSDFIVGADQTSSTFVGYAQTISGATGEVLATYSPRTHDPTVLERYGTAVAGGDLDGDGRPDVVVTAFDFDTGRGIVETWLTSIAHWSNYGAGLAGSLGVPTLTARQDPVVGQPLDLDLSDSAAVPTTGLLLLGGDAVSIPTGLGGTLLVAPLVFVPLSIQVTGLKLSGALPDDPTLYGFHFYAQALERDAAAVKGWSFTPGIELVFGFP